MIGWDNQSNSDNYYTVRVWQYVICGIIRVWGVMNMKNSHYMYSGAQTLYGLHEFS